VRIAQVRGIAKRVDDYDREESEQAFEYQEQLSADDAVKYEERIRHAGHHLWPGERPE
jgi:hypothetical protein